MAQRASESAGLEPEHCFSCKASWLLGIKKKIMPVLISKHMLLPLCPTLLHFDSQSICVKTLSNNQQERFFFVRVTHTWNKQVLLIIHHSLFSCLANFSHIAGDQRCKPGCSKIRNKQQTALGISQAAMRLKFARVRIQKITLSSITTSCPILEQQAQEKKKKKAEISSHLKPLWDLTHTDTTEACSGTFDAYMVTTGGRYPSTHACTAKTSVCPH